MGADSSRPISKAEIIAVGSELLTPFRIDTNSLYITRRLNELGIDVRSKSIVGDNRHELAARLRHALGCVDLIVVTGGLGPTDDDVTRETVAEVLGLPLEEDPSLVERIAARFTSRGLRMPEINRRQALVPAGAVALDNPRGTAPGLWIDTFAGRVRGTIVVLLPGPPRELEPMFEAVIRDRLSPLAGPRRLYRRTLRIAGRTESHVEEAAQPIYARWRETVPPIETTILAAPGQIELHLSVITESDEDAAAVLDRATEQLVAVLGDDVFSSDGRRLEEVVGDLLREARYRVAVAESCTGGLVGSRLTDVPGSSDYVERGFVTYSNQAKIELLGVEPALIEAHGAVSEPVALAMAEGAKRQAKVDVGVGVTGIAGPGGGSDAKPVGTVCVAVVAPGARSQVRTFRFPGARDQIKWWATQAALNMVRRVLIKRN